MGLCSVVCSADIPLVQGWPGTHLMPVCRHECLPGFPQIPSQAYRHTKQPNMTPVKRAQESAGTFDLQIGGLQIEHQRVGGSIPLGTIY